MTSVLREFAALARMEAADLVRSRWLACSTGLYALIAALLVVSARHESLVLGFGGMGRVLLSLTHVLLMVLPLLALTATIQVVNRARDDGTMELLFSQPLSRTGYLLSVTLTRYLFLFLPLALLFLALGVLARFGFGEEVPWSMLARTLAVSASLLWAFTGIGLAISVHTRQQTRAVTVGLLTWLASVALLDLALIGLLLSFRVDARALFVLASVNPVQAARLALLSGIEADLGTLGPVGFFLVHRIGGRALLWLGLSWPLVLGSLAWASAWRSFCKNDLL